MCASVGVYVQMYIHIITVILLSTWLNLEFLGDRLLRTSVRVFPDSCNLGGKTNRAVGTTIPQAESWTDKRSKRTWA